MSPRKIAISQSNAAKTPQTRRKKEKAVLKTPSIIKVKIKLPRFQDGTTQIENIGSEDAAKSPTEKKTEEQATAESASVKKRRRPRLQPKLENDTVNSEDAIEEVRQPLKETVAKKRQVKKYNRKQSTDEGLLVKNKAPPILSPENAGETAVLFCQNVAIEEKKQPPKKTVVKRKRIKKIQNVEQTVNKESPANLALENDNAEDADEKVKQLDIKKKTPVKRQKVNKIENGELTPGEGEPVKKKARTKLTPENDNAVAIEDTTEEVTQPGKKKKRAVKRKRVKKVQNQGKTARQGAPVKKKAPALKEKSRLEPENVIIVQTEGNQGANKVDDNEADTMKLNEHFYNILTANEVVNALKQKVENISPIENTLQVDKITTEKKSLVTKKIVNKKPVINGLKLDLKKKPLNVRTPGKKKPAETKKCATVRSKKVLNPKALTETKKKCSSNTIERDKKIETTKIKEPVIKENGYSSLISKVVKAGPKSRKLLTEMTRHTKNPDTDIDNSNINDTCKPNRRSLKASSNNSWAIDISTSSFSSLVTVNDLYVFNHKIPVLPLISIDNEFRKTNINNNNSNKYLKTLAMNTNMNAHDLLSTSTSKIDVTKLPNEPIRNQNSGDITEKNIAEIIATYPPVNLSASSSSSSSTSSSSASDASNTAAGVLKSSDQTTIISRMKTVLSTLNINKLELSPDINVEREYSNVSKVDVKNVQEKLKDLKGEIEIWRLCQAIIRLEMEEVEKYFNHNGRQETNVSRSITPESNYSEDSDVLHERANNSKDCFSEIVNNKKRCSTKKDEAVTCDKIAGSYASIEGKRMASDEIGEKIVNNSSDQNKPSGSSYIDNDDDDALSIYADSITDFETSRKSTVHSESTEEYVPAPVVPRKERLINYEPTKISYNKNSHYETITFTSNCEKQNAQPVEISNNNFEGEANQCTDTCESQTADSTSLFESGDNLDLRESSLIYEDRVGEFSQSPLKTSDVVTRNTQAASEPRLLMASIYNPNKIRSQVFKDFCIFFLRGSCKKYTNCNFRHMHPIAHEVKNALARISEETFIQEYMFMRRYPKLRRKYVICFVEEAIRRDLTRIVVEMAIDCVVKCSPISTVDSAVKSEALENILMYLNQVDLATCDDLLRYVVCAKKLNNKLLCDVFMSTIATSQNFTRFKYVFISLADFMCQNGRTFSVDVAEALLERLCILPYDETLARALLNILKNTDVTVFSNTKIQYLERQLLASNNDLYRELKLLKNKALVMQPVLANPYDHPYKPFIATGDKKESDSGNEHTIKPLIPSADKINTNFGNQPTIEHYNKVNSNFGYGQSFQQIERKTNFETNETIHDTSGVGNKDKPVETKFKMTMDLDKLRLHRFFKNENTGGHRESFNNPFTKKISARVLEVGENSKFNGTLRDDNIRNHSMIRPSNLRIGANITKQFANYQNTFKRTPAAPPQWYPRLPFKRRLDRSFGDGSTPKFQRNNGPSPFQRDLS